MSVRKDKKEGLSDQELLQGLWDNDMEILHIIYARYLPAVRRLVKNNNGSRSDAADVFQDALIVIFKKAKDPDFQLTSSLNSYILSIARFVWLRKLRKKNRLTEVTPELADAYVEEGHIEETLIQSEKRLLFQEKLSELGADCQQLLRLFFAGVPLREIAQQMGYTDHYVKKKNRICKQKLIEKVKRDRRYDELKN